jgi:hypothetical protein
MTLDYLSVGLIGTPFVLGVVGGLALVGRPTTYRIGLGLIAASVVGCLIAFALLVLMDF